MRLKPEIINFIKSASRKLFPESEIYLFGSRVNNNAKGGDIDLLILSDIKLENKELRRFRIDFYKKFGWQKIDLVNFTKSDNSIFKRLIIKDAQPI